MERVGVFLGKRNRNLINGKKLEKLRFRSVRRHQEIFRCVLFITGHDCETLHYNINDGSLVISDDLILP